MRRTIVLLAIMALTLLVASGGALAMAIGSAQAANKVVGPGESIQKAVNAADAGDTIVVRGVHREDVIIRKNGIKLRGVGNAVIEAPPRAKADSPCSKAFGPEAVCVLGDVNLKTEKLEGQRVSDVSVSGFTFRGFESAGKVGESAYVIDVIGARNATVVGNRAIGNRAIGNVASGINDDSSINTTVARNDVTGDPRGKVEGEGISIRTGRNTKILFTELRGIGILRSSHTRSSKKFAKKSPSSIRRCNGMRRLVPRDCGMSSMSTSGSRSVRTRARP